MKNWNQYSKEHYSFILGQSERLLLETNKTTETIMKRGRVHLLMGLSSILFILEKLLEGNDFISRPFSVVFIALMSVSVVLAIVATLKYTTQTSGTDSKQLMDPEFYDSLSVSDAELNLIRNECESYSTRIFTNEQLNRSRMALVQYSFYFLIASPLVSIVVALLCLA